MKNIHIENKLRQVSEEGYGLHLEGVLSTAFNVFKKAFFPGFVVTLIFVIVLLAANLLMFSTIYGIGFFKFIQSATENPASMEAVLGGEIQLSILIVFNFVISVATAILTPMLAGLYKVSYNAQHNEVVSVSDLFAYYKQPYFFNIFLYSFVFGFGLQLVNIGLSQVMPSLSGSASFAIQIVLSVTFILTVPFIVFGELSWTEAVKASIKVTSKNWFFLFFILAIAAIISFIGVFLCGIGFLFTYPFLYFTTYALYENIIGFSNDYDPISELGQK